jgi:hypothetical protein
MQLIKCEIKKDCNIYQVGDLHIGTIFHHSRGLQKTLDTIEKDKTAKVILMGDLCESLSVDDPYYDSDTNTEPVPFKQAKEIIRILQPIKKKIIAVLKGNHELRVIRYLNMSEYIASELGTQYGTWTSKVNFVDNKGNEIFKGLFCHGDQRRATIRSNSPDPIKREANEKAMLKDILYPKAGDCLYMGCGHYHRLIVVPPSQELYLTDDGKEIHQHYTEHPGKGRIHPNLRWYGLSGAFYKQYILGHDSYSEIAGYKPTELGYLLLRVENGLKYVRAVKI